VLLLYSSSNVAAVITKELILLKRENKYLKFYNLIIN